MKNIVPILLGLCVLSLCAVVSPAATPPANLRVLGCTPGGNSFPVIAPSATASIAVSSNASGVAPQCGVPSSFPQSYYVKTTLDGGSTWVWRYQVSDLFPTTTPPVTPPVTPVTPTQPTCPNTFVPVNWTCSAANGVATCTAPLT